MGNFFINLFKRFTTSKRKLSPFLRPPQLTFLEERITPATIIVNSLADNTTADAFTTLREAITTANASADADTIEFASSLFTGGAGTITLGSSLPAIVTATTAGTLTITGPGATSLTISGLDGGNGSRDFNIFNIASGGNLSISGVTVSGAKTSGNGGAFNNSGTLSVSNSTLSGNSAGTFGGAIFNNNGALTLTNSTLSGNNATYGGGISNQIGTITISNSTLSGNSATTSFGSGGSGGGIHNNGSLTVSNSTLSGNSAARHGGGIFNNSNLTLTNSTLSGNSASSSGGGIYNSGTLLTLTNSTLSNNSASNGGGIRNSNNLTITNSTFSGNSATTSGGGINNIGTLNIANTIIANSTNGGDFAGNQPVTSTNNIVEDGSITNGAIAADPLLGPLQNNGGPTFTHALLPGSPAIAAGNSTISNAAPINGLDQRGFVRTTSDIGAYSYNFASAGDAVVSLDNTNQVVLTLSSSGTAITDFHTTYNSGANTLTITAATTGTLLTAPSAGIAGISINGSTDTITLDLNTLVNFAGIVIVGNSGTGAVTIGAGGVDLSLVATGAANLSFTANILGTSNSTSALVLTDIIKTKGTAATYLSAGTINGSGLITTSSITMVALSGIGNTTALNLAATSISADSNAGKIIINNTSVTAVSVTSLTTTGSDGITFNQTGLGGIGIDGPVSTGTGTITITSQNGISGTGLITQANAAGGVTFNAGAGVITLTNTGNNFTGSVSLSNTGVNNVAITDVNAIDFAASTLGSGTFTVNAVGITQSGAITQASSAGTVTFNAGAGVITLANASNDFTGSVALNSTGATVAITDMNAIGFGSSSLGNGTFTVNAVGITQTGAITITGTSSFNAGTGDITLTQSNDFTGSVTLNSTGASVAITDANTIDFGASTLGSGTFTVTAVGITQSGAITQASGAGSATFNAGAGVITLANVGNDFTGSVALNSTGATVAITDTNALALASPNLGANTGITAIAGTTLTLPAFNFSTGTGNIDFQSASGTLATNGTLTSSSGTVSLKGSAGVTVGHNITTTSGSVSVIGAGINLTSGNTIDAGSSTITLDGNDGAITLTGALTTTNNTSAAIIIKDASTVSIGDITTGATGFVTLGGATTDNLTGAVTQTGVINIGTLTGNTAGDVTLLGGNTITNLGTFTSTGTGGFSLNDLGGLTVSGNVNNTSGAVSIVTTVSPLTISADITATSQSLTLTGVGINQTTGTILAAGLTVNAGAGSIALTQANNNFTGSVTLNSTGASVAITDINAIDFAASTLGSGTFTVTAVGITQSGAITVAGTSSFNAGAGVITLTQSNDFTGSVTLNSTGASVAITDANTIDFGASTLGSGTFTVTAVGITQSGAITITGTSSFNAGTGDITLTQSNDFTGSVTLNSTGASVAITDINAIDFGASTLGSGTFTVTAVGITQTGTITQASSAGTATFNAGAGVITLANASNDFTGSVALNSTGATVAITDTNALALASPNLGANTGITAIAGTTLTLPAFNFSTGTGNIDFQSASGTLATNGTLTSSSGTVSLKGSAGVTVGHNITTTTGAVSVTGAGINLTTGNTIDAGSSTITIDGNDGAITLTGALTTTNNTSAAIIIKDASTVSIGDITTGATGFVTLGGATTDNLTGAVTQTGVINTGTLIGNTAGDVTLLGGNTITNLGTFTSTGTSGFSLSDLGGLTVTGTVTNTSGAVSIVTTVSSLTISADITATGQSLTLTGVGINQTTGTILAAGLTVNAGAGSIALNQANNNFTGSVTLNSTGASVAITDTNAIDLAASVLGSGTFTVNAVGITQSGAITVAGTSSFNAGAGVITLTQSNDFTGAVSLNNSGANNVAIVDSNDITIGVTSLGTGTFAVTGTTINLNNNVTTTNNSQTYTGNVVVNTNSGGLPLVLSSGSGAINITSNVDSASGFNHSLTFTSTGDVTIGGTIGGTQALGTLFITGNDISLGNIGGANVGTTSNVSVQASDGADNGSITLTGTTYNTTGQQFYNSSAVASAFDATRLITLTGGSASTTVSLTSATGIETYGTIQLNNRVLSLNTSSGSSGFVTNDSKLPSLQVFEGPGSVVLDTGASGPIVINGAIGTVGTPLNSMTITNAANADFTGSIKVNTITITDTTDGGFVRFLGNLTVNTGMTVSPNGAYNVEILELSNVAGETTFGNSGLLTLGNAGSDVFNFTGGIIATNPSAINLIGTITAAGIGIITLGDSDTAINIKSASGFVGGTSTGTITLGNSILEDGVTLTVGTGITNAINLAAVTGTASGTSSNLTINTTGAVTVAGAVGTDIGLLTITNSGGTTFQSTVDAATTNITNTTGTVKFEGNLNLTTSLITANQGYNVLITGTSNNIAGATTFANTGAVTLGNGTNDSTTFAGGLVITAPASIAIQGTVATTNATMTLGDANTGITNNGTFSNPAILNAGAGIINLAGNVTGNGSNNPLKVTTSGVGFTTVSGVNTAELQLSSGVVTIANPSDQTGGYRVLGGTLQGGSMAKVGYIYAQTGTSTLAPGISGPGMMHTNSLLLSSGNTVEIDLQGTNPATGYDQIVVCTSGNVNLASATLSLSSSFTGNQGTIFTIIDNQDPTTAIQGTFAGLSEGAVVSVNGRAYQISYVGGTGNDVTLTVYDPATVTSFTPTIGKTGTPVVITGSNFTNVSQVSFNGTVQPTYTVDSPTQITTTIPSGATTGTISITTIAGTATSSSSITIDNTAPTLNISASPGSLKANETSAITFTFSEVVTGFSSSIITVTNGTITNPVASSSRVYTAVFTPTLGIKADGTISVSNNYFDSVGNQGTAATLTPPIAINTVQTPLVTGGASTTQGGASVVSLIDPDTGEVIGSAAPFPSFTGQIRVVSGDFNNDGKVDIIAAAGPGGGPAIAVLDSQTGEVLQSFFAFDQAFTGGVFIAVRDFNGDGILDIIAGAGAGGGPEVRIFNGNGLTVIRSFFAYAQDFTGGVSVASVDFNNDGILDLVTGAGPGGAPHVKVFDGATNSIISQWYAYPVSFTGGVYVAAGDIGNDGNIEVVTGAGSGGAPVVAVWDPYTGALLSQFMAYAEDFTGGVRVGVSDGNFDGILDLVTGAGPGGGPEVKGFSFPTLDLLFSFFSGDPANPDGVFVS